MERRFYCDVPLDADQVSLHGDEAQHLTRVLRARPGERVELFDGRGLEYTAEVASIGRRDVELTLISKVAVSRELAFPVHLAVALPKGDRQRWLVEKMVELGVSQLTPLETQRGVAQPTAAALERLRRYVIEASKQCGRNHLMRIGEPQELVPFARSLSAPTTRLIAHPASDRAAPVRTTPLVEFVRPAAAGLCALVGPEGGFTAEEVAAVLEAGWTAVNLGPRILRIETAALMLAAIAAAWS